MEDFLSNLERYKMEPDLYHTEEMSETIYGYDDKSLKRTFLTNNVQDTSIVLTIHNSRHLTLHHICVDGGMVTYGLEDYVGDGMIRGRFDSMLFTDSLLILVEYKTESTSERDGGRWKTFSKGMKQIQDYYLVLKAFFEKDGITINNYYKDSQIIPFICMPNLPELKPRVNHQRQNNMEQFRLATGLKLQYGMDYTISNNNV